MSRILQKEFDNLKKKILSLAALVEDSLQKAVRAVEMRDSGLANEVRTNDAGIDEIEVEVEEECLKILALHQPVAIDLRFIVAILKLNNDLERVGDLAVNLADLTVVLSSQKPTKTDVSLYAMAEKAQWMLKQSLDALINRDSELARRVCASDDEVDVLDQEIHTAVQGTLRSQPDLVESLVPILEASRHLERVADHATNIAEDVIYMVEGEIIRHNTAQTTLSPDL